MSEKATRQLFPCASCGNVRFTQMRGGVPIHLNCIRCSNQLRKKPPVNRYVSFGYIRLRLQPEDPFYSMCSSKGLIFEHRLVIAQSLNRCLESWEVVHHRNGNKQDNTLANLELLPNNIYHTSDSLLRRENIRLKKRMEVLLAQIKGH